MYERSNLRNMCIYKYIIFTDIQEIDYVLKVFFIIITLI